jgi:hypothetical protein
VVEQQLVQRLVDAVARQLEANVGSAGILLEEMMVDLAVDLLGIVEF